MLTCQTELSAEATARLEDPLQYLAKRGARPYLAAGRVRLTFDAWVRKFDRGTLADYARKHDWLLRLQLHVGNGQPPRSAKALLTAGKLAVRDGRYVQP